MKQIKKDMNTKRIVMILHKKGEAEDGQNKP
jgi:hypothetical protein